MHYRDGKEAQIGDVVRGKGYNLKNNDGHLKEFVGTVVGLTPGSSSCNIQVAHVVSEASPEGFKTPPHKFFHSKGVTGCGLMLEGSCAVSRLVFAVCDLEYGQCDSFELVYREDNLAALHKEAQELGLATTR